MNCIENFSLTHTHTYWAEQRVELCASVSDLDDDLVHPFPSFSPPSSSLLCQAQILSLLLLLLHLVMKASEHLQCTKKNPKSLKSKNMELWREKYIKRNGMNIWILLRYAQSRQLAPYYKLYFNNFFSILDVRNIRTKNCRKVSSIIRIFLSRWFSWKDVGQGMTTIWT